MKYSKKGSAIVIGMILTIIMSLSALVILSYMVPFSRETRGIENATNSYYQTYAGIEDSMFFVKERLNLTSETGSTMPDEAIGYSYNTISSGSIIPPNGDGNSDFDEDYNRLSINEPVQLQIGNISGVNWDDVDFTFQVPDGLGYFSSIDDALISWSLSSEDDTLLANENGYIKYNDFSNGVFNESIGNRQGRKLDGSDQIFNNFYDTNCDSSGNSCILRLIVVNDLVLNNGIQIPYLEYKIDFGNGVLAPLRFTRVNSNGKSYGYTRSMQVRVPQQTISQAFDFTVFQ